MWGFLRNIVGSGFLSRNRGESGFFRGIEGGQGLSKE